jgi:hypothetical protein
LGRPRKARSDHPFRAIAANILRFLLVLFAGGFRKLSAGAERRFGVKIEVLPSFRGLARRTH